MDIKKVFLVLGILCYNATIIAQDPSSVNAMGQNYTITSDILNEDRQIQILTPESYTETNKKYPVLYLLDGQRLFPFGVSLLKSFTQFRQTPEFIVVGITNSYPNRFGHFIDREKKFLTFMEEEVISFIDNNFRTSKERLLFGWEYGGSFVIQTMLDKPDLFSAYLAASPFPLDQKIDQISDFLESNTNFDKALYFSVSPNENDVTRGVKKLDSILKVKAPKTFNWSYRELLSEEHRSTPYSTIYGGLTTFYRYYPELQFNNLEEFTAAGGLSYVYDYYQKRAAQFGFPAALSDWTMFSLTRNAIRANDIEQFKRFISEFEATKFIHRLRVSRACLIAEFYAEHKEYDKAIDLFMVLTEKHPDAERPLNGLGDVYTALKKQKKASRYYKKAKEIAEAHTNQ